MSSDEDKAADKALVDELLETLEPLEVRARAMFGAWMVYVDDKPLGMVGDGGVYIKRSGVDDRFDGIARLVPPYPGAKDYWLMDLTFLRERPDDVRDLLAAVADALPAPAKRRQSRP
ncbi:hypothetical protein ACSL103130_05275 [Actinomyces slackii]|uniref:Regulator of competence-specific genes n=1 Tax=Actinomyces slackii TaxID=52774 RepID=A0A3S4U3P4_9ACTO|nr:hypothetical protein [Actinomyces slackii]VEG75729.1 Regulator of competence-specific genes [Actinomyces slackii]